MRYLFGFMCVMALGVMGCHEADITHCKSDSDCPDDGNECTFGRCQLVGFCGYFDVADGKTCSDGVCLSGECTALTSVSGTVTVIDVNSESPAADAEVSWFGTSFSTTTDTLGEFSLELPFGTVVLHASRDGAWSGVEFGTVSDTGLVNPNIEIVADALVAQIEGDLMRDIDEEKGIVSVDFGPASAVVGGETVSSPHPDPASLYDFGFTSDAGGNWVISEELLPAGSRILSFSGVQQSSAVVLNPQGVEGVNTCGLAENPAFIGSLPVRPKTVTRVQALCAPIP